MKTPAEKYILAKKKALRAYRFYDQMPSSDLMKHDAYKEWQRLESIVEELDKLL